MDDKLIELASMTDCMQKKTSEALSWRIDTKTQTNQNCFVNYELLLTPFFTVV